MPPIEFVHGGDTGLTNQGAVAERHQCPRCAFYSQLFQRGEIEMIIVVVGHQHRIDGRQVIQTKPRPAVSSGDPPTIRDCSGPTRLDRSEY